MLHVTFGVVGAFIRYWLNKKKTKKSSHSDATDEGDAVVVVLLVTIRHLKRQLPSEGKTGRVGQIFSTRWRFQTVSVLWFLTSPSLLLTLFQNLDSLCLMLQTEAKRRDDSSCVSINSRIP